MIECSVYCAQPTVSSDPVPTARISIRPALPDYGLADGREVMQDDAEKLCLALRKSLPQGTLDRLAILLIQRMVSDFVIADESIRKVKS